MLRTAWVLALLALASNCDAFFDPPAAVPANATPVQMVSVDIRKGICDLVFDGPNDTEVAMTNNVRRLILDGAHEDDPIFCNFPISTVRFPLGKFSAGEYVVNVFHRYTDFFGVEQTVLVGTTMFTVTGAVVHHPIPVTTDASTMALLLVVALTGILAARQRARVA